jgi:pSer/pThr/pTyr-binding forkhead associated (FHA) protein
MQRSFTIIEGEGKGQIKPFTSSLMIVGRAQEAEIHVDDVTNKVSRRHLQVRVEAGVVFVENMSPYGALLNGKAITSAVSLDAGDTIKIGEIQLRYEEKPDGPKADLPKPETPRDSSARDGDIDPKSVEYDATRVADPSILAAREKERQKAEADDGEGTRVADEDKTRMMNPDELGKFRAAVAVKAQTAPTRKIGILIVFVLAALGAVVWLLHRQTGTGADAVGSIAYNDPLYPFNFSYPVNWARMQDSAEVIGFGFGKEGDADMARVDVFHDKQPDYALTGLTDGFLKYVEVLKKRFKGFELTSQERKTSSDATAIFFGFRAATQQGKGIYLLDAETRLVMECYSPSSSYERYRPVFNTILESFHLAGDRPQEFIEYAMPDASLNTLASSSPVELSRQLQEHLASGGDLLKNRLLRPENLDKSIQEYRQALQLSMAGPERLPEWRPAAEGLAEATRLFHQELDAARLKIKIAIKEGNRDTAYWEARQMLQMVPDKTDPAYFEAYATFQTLSKGHR